MENYNSWLEIGKLFDAVCELPIAKQILALKSFSAGNAELYDEVNSLLTKSRESKDFLETSVFEKCLMILIKH